MVEATLAKIGIGQKRRQKKESKAEPLKGVSEGQRNDTCFRLAMHYKGKGLSGEETLSLLQKFAQNCNPPLPESEVRACVKSAYSYDSAARGEAKNQKQVSFFTRASEIWEEVIQNGEVKFAHLSTPEARVDYVEQIENKDGPLLPVSGGDEAIR